jgi:outer membrane protein OmpA-like peptidoglycan-associated protein
MSDSPLRIVPNPRPHTEPPARPAPASADAAGSPEEMDELRRLLVGPEQQQIANILERLNNPRVRAREMSRALTESVRLRTAEDETLTEALAPTVVTAFHGSIKKNPKPVADAIAPLMGPAIRRYISMMLNGMVQSFDQALKYSLSWQGVKWRLEAARTGKSFAEIVMLHTLVYRVEQVFLIHKPSGVKLHHVSSESVRAQDADIVSGMMTAIQDAIKSFAHDSFGSAQDETIDTLDLGDREVWFEAGPHAALAVLIRGKAPENLRGAYFVPALEAIHVEMSETLQSFDGDDAPFELVRPHLESCLLSRYEGQTDEAAFRVPWYIWVLLALVLAGLVAWAYFASRDHRRWTGYVETLRQTPGLVITEEGRRGGKRYVAGLRDPLAAQPAALLAAHQLDPADVDLQNWRPYQAFDGEFTLRRARQLLAPPAGVTLRIRDQVLAATGVAPAAWIADARRFAPALPGVASFDERELVSEETRRLEARIIRFVSGGAEPVAGQQAELQAVAADVQRVAQSDARARIELIGHTDAEGDAAANQRLSEARAVRLRALLAARGVNPEILPVRGVASSAPLRTGGGETESSFNRSVSFQVKRAGEER